MSGEAGADPLLEITRALGRIEGKLDGVSNHVVAVNGKLNEHIKDPDAHPQLEHRAGAAWATWLGVALAVAALIVSFKGGSHGPEPAAVPVHLSTR